MRLALLATMSFSLGFLPAALAQNGTLDQVSPIGGAPPSGSAWFNGDAPSLVWQVQVDVGLAGVLEGFNLTLDGGVGSQVDVRLRMGAGWNTGPIVYSTQLTKALGGWETVFVDVTSANQSVVVGNKFVIELQGNSTGCGLIGSYVSPVNGPPLYAEPLYLNGPGCFADCGWRIAFDSFVLTGPTAPVVYCTAGTTSNGCTASISASGAPNVAHSAPCQITINNVEGQKTGIVFYGLGALPQPWCSTGGTSFLCVKPPTMRSGTQSSGGTAGLCNGTLGLDWNTFQLANPGALGQPWSSGNKAFVQAWFRDPPSCKTTSLSNAVELTYAP
jgi:hypothetical protein